MKRNIVLATLLTVCVAAAPPQSLPILVAAPMTGTPPKEWIDKTTGHHVVRISDEAGSSSNYFNHNSYTPDGRWMVYSSPSGIMALDLRSFQSKLIIPGKGTLEFVGRKSGDVYYTIKDQAPDSGKDGDARDRGASRQIVMAYNFSSGVSRLVLKMQPGFTIATINADETLFAGARNTGPSSDAPPGSVMTNRDPADEILPDGRKATYAEGREIQINRRLSAKIPMEIFTVNIRTGALKTIVASTDWLNHLEFSPTDPTLLLYCHEGNWHVVDRMWLVHVDRPDTPRLLHRRTMNMEIAGHEWWGADGKTVWYDLQTPRGEDFWVAGINVITGKRSWYHIARNEWGVHFNRSNDGSLFSSDGGDPEMAAHAPDGKYIYIFRPRSIPDVAGIHASNSADLITPGVLDAEKLVDLKNHDYRFEPNASFTPDGKWLIFRSNMWGQRHVYAVEIAKH